MKPIHIIILAAAILASCSTPRSVTYFQDIQPGSTVTPAQELEIRLRPDDRLAIMVTSSDPAISTMFNLLSVQNRAGATTAGTHSSGTMATSQSGNNTSLYTVDHAGDINFPVLGRLHVAGMTRYELVDFLEQRLIDSKMIKDPIVVVDFANTGITMLGEVGAPGRYEFNKNTLTIVEALAMAGDLPLTGRRDNILVLRDNGHGRQTAYRVDLTDLTALSQSPVYYMQQNDVIYVEPIDKRKREVTPNGNSTYTPAFWMSITSFAITLVTLAISLSK